MCWTVNEGFDGTYWSASLGRKYKTFNTYEEAKAYADKKNAELYANNKLNKIYAM